ATRVAELLRERIADGRAAPGSRIVELEVARELGISRSPVREALLRLSQEGLVTILPYRGAIVVPLQRRRFAELMEFRLALEHFALERLVERADAVVLADLRARVTAIRRALRAGDRRRAIDEDLAIHRALVAAAGNALLERTYDGLLAQIRLYIDVTSARYERAEDLAEEHAALLVAVERRDLAAARELLDAHVVHGFDSAHDAAGTASQAIAGETSHNATGSNARRIPIR
ncbi:MAG: GntR family transcriptional regulator, partial [Candidatus Tumulicola sp.]